MKKENYKIIHTYSNGISEAQLGEYYGFMDSLGNTIVPFEYDEIFHDEYLDINYDFIGLRKGDKWGYFNKKGEAITPLIYDQLSGFPNPWDEDDNDPKYSWVMKNGKWGTIDISGKEVIPFIYEAVHESGAWVKKDNKWGIVDYQNKEMIPFQYDDVGDFGYMEYYWVMKNEKYGLIDFNGKELTPIVYDGMVYGHGIIGAKQGDKFGLLEGEASGYGSENYDRPHPGSVLAPIIYKSIEEAYLSIGYKYDPDNIRIRLGF